MVANVSKYPHGKKWEGRGGKGREGDLKKKLSKDRLHTK